MKFKRLISILLILVSIGVFVGCNNFSSKSVNENQSGGKCMVVPYSEDVSLTNPAFMQINKLNLVGNIIYSPFYIYRSGEIQTYLANSVEFKDNKELMIELRKGLKWHDGEPITADDIIYTLEVILDKEQGSPLRNLLVIDEEPVTVQRVNDLTVKILLPKEKADFIHKMSRIAPIPKHIYESETNISTSDKNKNPIGSGPFKFKSWVIGEELVLEKFNDYFLVKPKIDKITFKKYNDIKGMEEAMVSGELTLMEGDPDMISKYKDDSAFQVYQYNQGKVNYIVFNQNVEKLKNTDLRKALCYGFNRKKLIEAAYGDENATQEAKSILLPEADFYREDTIEEYNYDIEKAKEFLRKSQTQLQNVTIGYNIEEPIHVKYAEKAKAQLSEIGISAELKGYVLKDFLNTLFSNSTECDMYIGNYSLGVNPDDYRVMFESSSYYNQTGYSNPNLDKLWKEGFSELDNEQRKKIYREIQETVLEEAPIYLIDYQCNYILAKSNLAGIENGKPTTILLFEDWSELSIKN